jgi:ClpP class serine protease
MSAGTMIALSCKEIMMGRHSSLGPIDPQMGGIPCQAVIAEFDRAKKEILENSDVSYLWQFIISKYHPTFLSTCQNAIDLSNQLAREWLKRNMFSGDVKKVDKVLRHFSSHFKSKTHARHISMQKCKELGLNVIEMETNNDLQDLLLAVHHTFMHTFSQTNSLKIIENQFGAAYVEALPQMPQIQMPFLPQQINQSQK